MTDNVSPLRTGTERALQASVGLTLIRNAVRGLERTLTEDSDTLPDRQRMMVYADRLKTIDDLLATFEREARAVIASRP